jgi:hypothetical protein
VNRYDNDMRQKDETEKKRNLVNRYDWDRRNEKVKLKDLLVINQHWQRQHLERRIHYTLPHQAYTSYKHPMPHTNQGQELKIVEFDRRGNIIDLQTSKSP